MRFGSRPSAFRYNSLRAILGPLLLLDITQRRKHGQIIRKLVRSLTQQLLCLRLFHSHSTINNRLPGECQIANVALRVLRVGKRHQLR